MNSTEKTIANYQTAVKHLLQAVFDQQRIEDSAQYASCSMVIQSGGMVQLRSNVLSGGVLETSIEVVDASGETFEVGRLETGIVNH